MTINDAVNIWMPVVAMGVENMPEIKEAVNMAIVSLEAWQEVRQKIGKLSLSWEYGQGVEDCLAIVDHYMQEVDDGK